MSEWNADPVLLKTFLAVRRHGNLTRAAEDLFVTQSAVSRRIERLEKSLGLPLFERLGKTLHPTEAGVALSREAASLLGSVDRMAETVRAHRDGDAGRVRIGASTTPGLYVLPGVLRRFQARFPNVEVSYAIENSLRIEEKLVRNDLDVALVGAHLTHAALSVRVWVQDEIAFYAAADHPLAQGRALDPRELERHTCIAREAGSATRRQVEKWMRSTRVRLGQSVEIGCPEAARVLVRAGMGFSYMSTAGLRGEQGRGLKVLATPQRRITRPLFVVRHADKRPSLAMTTFVEMCHEEGAGLA
jgi:DNA-binding transcriptional LysR family regulator